MDYIIIGLLIVVLLISIFSLSKNINESKISDRLSNLEKNTIKELGEFKVSLSKELSDNASRVDKTISEDLAKNIKELGEFKSALSRNMNDDFIKINKSIEEKLSLISDKVNERLDQNFDKTNKTFNNILERLTKIDEAQKKIETLSSDIVSLQGILTDKKTRGTFGEVNLNNILSSVFGENNTKIYELQHKFDNGNIADAVLYAPEPLGLVAIDSKFPLENYQNMVNKNISKIEREIYEKKFKSDVKKHIDAISSKYIIKGETSDQAIMFLPAEAIFAEINAYHNDLLKYAYDKRVWITSPTTLMSTLSIIQMILKNMERDKYAKVIHLELSKLSDEFSKYRVRWDKLNRSIETVTKDIKDINITTDKITKRFDAINKVDIKVLENKEDSE